MSRLAALGFVAALLAGCVHAPLNRPLTDETMRFRPPALRSNEPGDDTLIALFFSGGGTRAAALSYGVMKELQKDGLLPHIMSISAVSGGSFTAAYYSLYGDRLFQDFETLFLKRDVNAALLGTLLNPITLAKLASPYYGRSDMAAEYYDRLLFHGATFGDLFKGPRHPFLVLNATDMANGSQFPFTADRFAIISSDLYSFPISRAVAAASAFPVLLSPVTLRNYRGVPGVPLPDVTLYDPGPHGSHRDQMVWEAFQSYGDYRHNPYVHLVDGGVSDDLGLEALIDADLVFGGLARLMEQVLGAAPPRRLVIIVVNAAVHRSVAWSRSEAVPGPASVLWRLADNLGDHVDAEFLDLLKPTLERWKRDAAARLGVAGSLPEYYVVPIDFAQISDPNERMFFENLPTNFHLKPQTVDRVVDVGGRLLRDSPEFQAVRRQLDGPP